jgi:DNA-binding transcriptional regulator YhcF (GntR family)
VSNGRSLSNSMIEEVLKNDKKDEIMKDIETFISQKRKIHSGEDDVYSMCDAILKEIDDHDAGRGY